MLWLVNKSWTKNLFMIIIKILDIKSTHIQFQPLSYFFFQCHYTRICTHTILDYIFSVSCLYCYCFYLFPCCERLYLWANFLYLFKNLHGLTKIYEIMWASNINTVAFLVSFLFIILSLHIIFILKTYIPLHVILLSLLMLNTNIVIYLSNIGSYIIKFQ